MKFLNTRLQGDGSGRLMERLRKAQAEAAELRHFIRRALSLRDELNEAAYLILGKPAGFEELLDLSKELAESVPQFEATVQRFIEQHSVLLSADDRRQVAEYCNWAKGQPVALEDSRRQYQTYPVASSAEETRARPLWADSGRKKLSVASLPAIDLGRPAVERTYSRSEMYDDDCR